MRWLVALALMAQPASAGWVLYGKFGDGKESYGFFDTLEACLSDVDRTELLFGRLRTPEPCRFVEDGDVIDLGPNLEYHGVPLGE